MDLSERSFGTPGVHVAHDSKGTPRYVGRGAFFPRLKGQFEAHRQELRYFSIYVVKEKLHERKIETLLIRAAGARLYEVPPVQWTGR